MKFLLSTFLVLITNLTILQGQSWNSFAECANNPEFSTSQIFCNNNNTLMIVRSRESRHTFEFNTNGVLVDFDMRDSVYINEGDYVMNGDFLYSISSGTFSDFGELKLNKYDLELNAISRTTLDNLGASFRHGFFNDDLILTRFDGMTLYLEKYNLDGNLLNQVQLSTGTSLFRLHVAEDGTMICHASGYGFADNLVWVNPDFTIKYNTSVSMHSISSVDTHNGVLYAAGMNDMQLYVAEIDSQGAIADASYFDDPYTFWVEGLEVTDDAVWLYSPDPEFANGIVYRFDKETLEETCSLEVNNLSPESHYPQNLLVKNDMLQIPGGVEVNTQYYPGLTSIDANCTRPDTTSYNCFNFPMDDDNDGFTADEDCNDNDPSVNPGALEVCDGIDNNCDGIVDEGSNSSLIVNCPPYLIIECPIDDSVVQDWLSSATAIDSSGQNLTISNNYDPTHFDGECFAEAFVVFSAGNSCQDSFFCQSVIVVEDTFAPFYSGEPTIEFVCDGMGNSEDIYNYLDDVIYSSTSDCNNFFVEYDYDGEPFGSCSETKDVAVFIEDKCGNAEEFVLNFRLTDDVPGIPAAFDPFPWVMDLMEVQNCEETMVTLYSAGAYNFIHVATPEEGVLYFETGQLYCTDAAGFDCAVAYGLTEVEAEWTCSDGGTGGTTGEVPEWVEGFPFISSVVDLSDCEDTEIRYYDFGSYGFVYIDNGTAGVLYLNDGTRYCSDGPNTDCEMIYGLTNPTEEWTCGSGDAGTTTPTVFKDYPWLSDIIDSNDCMASVSVYNLGAYTYVFVTNENGLQTMYSEGGLLYCMDFPGLSCFSTYGFSDSDLVTQWDCPLLSPSITDRQRLIEPITKDALSFSIFPNPSYGEASIISSIIDAEMKIMDMQGQLVHTATIENETSLIDLNNLAPGTYIVMLSSEDQREVKKFVKL